MIDSSAVRYADKNAFLIKNAPGGTYIPIKFSQLKKDIDELGTALMDLGLTGKKIALIGENRYEWVVTYFAVVNGVGVIVPLRLGPPKGELVVLGCPVPAPLKTGGKLSLRGAGTRFRRAQQRGPPHPGPFLSPGRPIPFFLEVLIAKTPG